MKELDVVYHISNEKCQSGYISTIVSSPEGLVYPDEILGFMPDMITINQKVKFINAEGKEEYETKKIVLMVGKEENASQILNSKTEYLVGKEYLENSVPLLAAEQATKTSLPHISDIDPYIFLRRCTGTPSKMIVYENKEMSGKYIFPKTSTTKAFEDTDELKIGFHTFVNNYFANQNKKGENPTIYVRKIM